MDHNFPFSPWTLVERLNIKVIERLMKPKLNLISIIFHIFFYVSHTPSCRLRISLWIRKQKIGHRTCAKSMYPKNNKKIRFDVFHFFLPFWNRYLSSVYIQGIWSNMKIEEDKRTKKCKSRVGVQQQFKSKNNQPPLVSGNLRHTIEREREW